MPQSLRDGEQELLDAAWRRWERGEVDERSKSPAVGDAWKLENGLELGPETDALLPTKRRHRQGVDVCAVCGRVLSEVRYWADLGAGTVAVGPECIKGVPEGQRIKRE
jgi:hypothetical protein